jgi:hypothetical protein
MKSTDEEFPVHIAGDPPEHYRYHGGIDDPRGMASDCLFDKLAFAHPKIRWHDRLVIGDLYKAADEATLVIICPKCLHQLTISSKNKSIHYDEETGLISIERFGCTWELDDKEPTAQHFGMSLCGWSVVVDNGVARDV